ncbi:hypothetical protein Ciccas_003902 [Cichlidogyrus casuarinus]|uniref:LicD/FKTN/FKRP nucleotidyltransferase domain-containing protein n=1 Tax=Cichlidogyrus casuarinus TaxID=1844966 RepID=A0ABD2QD59_9PLAT
MEGSHKLRIKCIALLLLFIIGMIFLIEYLLVRNTKQSILTIARNWYDNRIIEVQTDFWLPNLKNALIDQTKNKITIGTEEYLITHGFNFHNLSEMNNVTVPRPYQVNPVYLIENSSGSLCRKYEHNSRRNEIFHIIQKWITVSTAQQIIWWLWYGSLLSSIRNKDINPWDTDSDLCMLDKFETVLRSHETQKLAKQNGIRIIVRPSVHCGYGDSDRRSCNGIKVKSLVDSCSFCGPLARILSNNTGDHGIYVDIYRCGFYYDSQAKHHKFYDEGTSEDVPITPQSQARLDALFPLSICEYMSLKLPCPRVPSEYLHVVYGKNFLTPQRKCNPRTGTYVKMIN